MSLICPADGHITDDPDGRYCAEHGVPWFNNCPDCRTPWPLVAKHNYMGELDHGGDFCASCGTPAPWLSRPQLMTWIQNQLRASAGGDVSRETALELVGVLTRLEQMDPNDTKTVEAWKRVRDAAPKVWDATKPVRDALIGEAVKRALGL